MTEAEPEFDYIIYNKEFTLYELKRALQNCKSGAPGEDKILYDIIKNFPDETKLTLLSIFNKSWKEGTTPSSWNEAIIIPLVKPSKYITR
jgi:hypothetical protein